MPGARQVGFETRHIIRRRSVGDAVQDRRKREMSTVRAGVAQLRRFGEQQKPKSLSVVNYATNQNGLRGTECQRDSFSDSSMTTILQREYFFCGLILYHPHSERSQCWGRHMNTPTSVLILSFSCPITSFFLCQSLPTTLSCAPLIPTCSNLQGVNWGRLCGISRASKRVQNKQSETISTRMFDIRFHAKMTCRL
jgi:hypothetical protein